MDEVLTPDLCVIGAGAGGLTAASLASQLGASAVLIEKHKMGGDCLNYGCVPSKALLAAAKRAQLIRDAGKFGIQSAGLRIDYEGVHDHVRGVIAGIEQNETVARFEGMGVKVIAGAAQFVDRSTVAVNGQTIKARRFIVATGSKPAIPPIPGLDTVPYLTSETVFGVSGRMEHLLIIGAGSTGMELGQAYRRLGSNVTILDAAFPLAHFDPELSALVVRRLEREGVRISSGVQIERVEPFGENIQVIYASDGQRHTVEVTHLLVAAGRAPVVGGLNLDAARIRYDAAGIYVNDGLKTSNGRVYAIGDVTGKMPYSHVASYHASLAVRNFMFRLPVKARHDGLPRVTFTSPELAQTGLTEAQARELHQDIRVLRWPYRENDRAHAEHATEGFVKVVTTQKGRILGAGAAGEQAGEIIQLWSLAMQQGIGIWSMASYVAAYPTFAEMNKRAAVLYFLPKLASPFVRRIAGWLAKLG